MDEEAARDALSARATASPDPVAQAIELVRSVTGDGAASAEEVLAALTLLRGLREELAAWEPRLITAAREGGTSWVRLAPALGVASRQAAERRYLRLRTEGVEDPESTGERRVRAERDRRAGERAVHAWAEENAAELRGLSGRVAGLSGLTGAARKHVGEVRDALGSNNSAALLGPLADAAAHLHKTHPLLAREITELTQRTDRLRGAQRER
ncbi:HSP18 transcriptional regulator [Allokutzneria sp. A3M-2-11 16]|uniref:HSP18 transcriptional regulator n=1 Tax=Allokutzneria sp. A3M-2-11 16 TaxID=2962043 RepID=UPI0020B7FDD9|nr:HSP18 transcriptional regulator [Allokutzneria sp. A3M-2-11 16]MCP3803994.1 HSP18 transcriptional regulator [Allokutzneria sp. A3M-2-11 16]